MALRGHQGIELGLARCKAALAQLMPMSNAQPAQFRLQLGSTSNPDKDALAQATAWYAGTQTLTVPEFESLNWLRAFAQSGRQLLLCHAMQLLDGWNRQRRPALPIAQEVELLDKLSASASSIAATLHESQQSSLLHALALQVRRVQQATATEPSAMLVKAMSLASAANVLFDGKSLFVDASKLVQAALPKIVAADGSPIGEPLARFVPWIDQLLATPALAAVPQTRAALDRAIPFLAMLMRADGKFCLNLPNLALSTAATAMAPLQQAWVGHAARLERGKTVVIALPQQLADQTMLSISSRAHHLLDAGCFVTSPAEGASTQEMTVSEVEAAMLIRQHMQDQQRMVYLSAKGDDIRVEDRLQLDHHTRWLRISLASDARISVARNGQQATIALDGKNLWQFTLRGARVLPMQDTSSLYLEHRPNQGRTVNWALKRIGRNSPKANRDQLPELPF